MKVALLAPSPWSDVSLAAALAMERRGIVVCGIASLPALHWKTLLRKAKQLGSGAFLGYAARRLAGGKAAASVRNPHLDALLGAAPEHGLREFASRRGIPIWMGPDLNAPAAVEAVKAWSPDVLVYTGGGIVRQALLGLAPHGVLNAHMGLLPDARGMNAAEWSVLMGVALGITVHRMDRGIDTGPVLLARTLPQGGETLEETRARLVALGVELLAEGVAGLASGSLIFEPQVRLGEDLQHFVMHDTLKAHVEGLLREGSHAAGDPPHRPGARAAAGKRTGAAR